MLMPHHIQQVEQLNSYYGSNDFLCTFELCVITPLAVMHFLLHLFCPDTEQVADKTD